MYKDECDKRLVELTLCGDSGAFEQLVVRHKRAVLGTAYKITRNHYSAEDAAQEAFVAAWLQLKSLTVQDKFGSYVCAIAKNYAKALKPGGYLCFEFDMGQGDDVCAILEANGYTVLERTKDYNDRERAVIARYDRKEEE